MAETTLRNYIRTIDSLIDAEKLDEAIAHCRNILQYHPKHLETYRLLGKAYLEAKKHGDAADIFQRVLSAVPDDFVSHIGMSIVREDEGNTESAIWHMERAFETNPSNPAIQQELKRLIGRRDGIEPPKVRLTRGALARMYTHGELYRQAIAELRSALREEPDRPDLQVLLADLYWQTDQRVEAAEVGHRILEKLPYCQPALRIMAAALQETGKGQEATRYHRRLAQLDPYFAYVESPMMDTLKVDPDSVRIEALSWQPGEPMPGAVAPQGDWASSLGIEITEEEEGAPLPTWLADVSDEDDAPEPESIEPHAPMEEFEPDTTEEEIARAELPEWMEEAGWEPASGEAEEGPVSFSAEELSTLERGELPPEPSEFEAAESDDQELEPAQIPSWLQDKVPGELPSVEEELAGADIPEWLDDLDLGAEAEADEPAEAEVEASADELASLSRQDDAETGEAEEELEPADVPSWLDDGEPGATSTIMSWLGDRPGEVADRAEAEGDAGAAADDSESWIDDAFLEDEAEQEVIPPSEPTADEEATGPETGIPGWLAGMAEASATSEDTEREELDRFRKETAASLGDEEDILEEPIPADIPDWLQQIAGRGETRADEPTAEEPREEEGFEAAVSELEDELPDVAEQIEPDLPVAELDADVETPDWLRETFEPTQEAPEDTEESEPAVLEAEPEVEELSRPTVAEDEEVEDWLSNLATGEPIAERPAEPVRDEVEDWLSGPEGPQGEEPPVEDEAATWLADLGEEPHTTGQTWAEMTASEPDWLDGLAEEEPDEQVEELAGGWLDDLSETLADTPAEPLDESMQLEEEDVPDWLRAFDDSSTARPPEGAEPPQPPAHEEAQEDEDLSWLQDIAEQASTDEAPVQPEPAPSPDLDMGELDQMDEDEIFQWLENMAAQQEQGEATTPQPDARAETAPTSEPAEEAGEEDLEWLSKLAEQRGIDADLQPASRRPPEEPSTTLPESDTRPTEARPRAPEPTPQQEAAPPQPPVAPVEQEQDKTPDEALPWEDAPGALEERPVEQPPAPVEPEQTPASPPSFREEVQLESPGEPEPEALLPAVEPEPGAEEPIEKPPVPVEPEQAATPPPSFREDVQPEQPAEPEREQLPRAADVAPDTEPPQPELPVKSGLPAEPPSVSEPAQAAPTEAGPQEEEAVPDWLKPIAEQSVPPSAPPAEEESEPDKPVEEPAVSEPETKPEREPAPPEPVSESPRAPDPEPEPEPTEARSLAPEPSAPAPEAPEPEPAPKLPERLHAARAALAEGDHRTAAGDYDKLLKLKEYLDQVIGDLEPAVEEYPESGALWQTLGDAYMKAGRTKDAARAYNEGMRETEVLESARQALAAGDFTRAAAQYGILIKDRKGIETVIGDLEAALEYEESAPIIWQTLGDAYMKVGRLNDSIKAYRQGMDSV